ncbi:hypothetical protein N2599_03630 [Rhizobium sullae]|uniref:Uncharacterized protein n=1 Tax=Rhizobium sullae TaxID=50338 RepID=A0A2N0D2N4_RHISU|nr:hypothetical protein [Rhizobium sullae]PKA40317.1 hypothetical protein CWR43_27385 [Rhizobium sullae]UWU15122.1 hypothetical protein N2599_03630 [Rhizobium sullae]
MNIGPPTFDIDDVRRANECACAFDHLTKQVAIEAVNAGWLEGEVALALADAAERYVMHIAAGTHAVPVAANCNTARAGEA